MATLLSAIEEEVGNLTTRVTFHYSDLEESNAMIYDRLQPSDFPACLILPIDITDSEREHGKLIHTAEVNAIFLNRFTNEATIDKSISEINTQFVEPMTTLARQFINRLDENDIIEGTGIDSVVHRSTHQALFDAHLYGCWSVFTIKYYEGLSTCPS